MTIHPGVVFLERAHARLMLVEAGALDIDDAIDGLIPAFSELRPCICRLRNLERLERLYPLPAKESEPA